MTSYPCNKYEQITPSYLLSVKYIYSKAMGKSSHIYCIFFTNDSRYKFKNSSLYTSFLGNEIGLCQNCLKFWQRNKEYHITNWKIQPHLLYFFTNDNRSEFKTSPLWISLLRDEVYIKTIVSALRTRHEE